jgi:cytochrome P450
MSEPLYAAEAPLPKARPLFDPRSPDLIRDPYPFYERLRTIDPVHLTSQGNYVASRHAEVSHVLRDKRFGKDFAGRISRRYGPQAMDEPVFQAMGHTMMEHDPPEHTRLRDLIIKSFTARRVEDMRPRIQQIVDDALDRVEKLGRMDLIKDLAFHLPITVILDLLGIPADQRERFYRPVPDRGRLLEPIPLSRAEIDAANAANLSGRGYFLQLCELRRKQPGDDLITRLVQAEDKGLISNLEVTSNIMLLFGAGHSTIIGLIGNGLLALFQNPDQLALLKANPALITNAIEEFLRYDAPVQLARRVALEDIDDLGGKPIPKGESVLCPLGSAHRDPAAFADHPDRLDITRPNVRSLAFGGGVHFCLGAQLARVEAEVAIATLLRRFPGIRLDDSNPPKRHPTLVLRGLRELPAVW